MEKSKSPRKFKHQKLAIFIGIVLMIALANVLIGVFAGWDIAAIP